MQKVLRNATKVVYKKNSIKYQAIRIWLNGKIVWQKPND